MKVEVEYCGAWGYGPRYKELARTISAALPEAECVGTVGRRSSFEVKLDGTLIYSKLESGGFPQYEDVVKAIEAVKGGQPIPAIGQQASGCSIM